MGFEVSKGHYVTFDKQELKELRPPSTRAIEVDEFVLLEEIDPIYYERTYWLGPDGDAGKKAYGLLLSAMEERQRVAIGTVVMRNKQYLTAVRPLDGALAMSTMRFADEIVPRSASDGIPTRPSKPEQAALKMAMQLVDGLAAEWDPTKYRDTYVDELRKRIKARQAGKELVQETAAAESNGKVLDLMAALEASLQASKTTKKPRPPERLAARRPARARRRKARSPRAWRPRRPQPRSRRPPRRPVPRRVSRPTRRSATSPSPPSPRASAPPPHSATDSSSSVTAPGDCTTTCASRPMASS